MFCFRFSKFFCAVPVACAAGAFVTAFSFGTAQAQNAAAPSAPDRAHIEEVLHGLERGRSIGQVAISPDGKRLAWIEGGRGGGDILVAPLEDLKQSERVTAATKPDEHCQEGEIAWKPDSKALAFFSDCAHPGDQDDLYLSRLDGSTARRLTDL